MRFIHLIFCHKHRILKKSCIILWNLVTYENIVKNIKTDTRQACLSKGKIQLFISLLYILFFLHYTLHQSFTVLYCMHLWMTKLAECWTMSTHWKTLRETDRERGVEYREALRKRDPWRLTKHKTSQWSDRKCWNYCSVLGGEVRLKCSCMNGSKHSTVKSWLPQRFVVILHMCLCMKYVWNEECVFMSDYTVYMWGSHWRKIQRYWRHYVSINCLYFFPQGREWRGVMTKLVKWWAVDALHQPLKMNNSDQELLIKRHVLHRIIKVFHRLSSICPELVLHCHCHCGWFLFLFCKN